MKIFVSKLRKLFIISILLVSAICITATTKAVVWAQEAQESQLAGNDYTLPYTGLLPDSPLYPLKKMRDSVWVFFTRDSMKKAELLLLLSDKKIVMAQVLADKGKWERALEIAQDSEEDVTRMITALEMAKRIGYAPSADFRMKAQKSSTKHLKMMKDFMRKADPAYKPAFEELMKRNVDNYNKMGAV